MNGEVVSVGHVGLGRGVRQHQRHRRAGFQQAAVSGTFGEIANCTRTIKQSGMRPGEQEMGAEGDCKAMGMVVMMDCIEPL